MAVDTINFVTGQSASFPPTTVDVPYTISAGSNLVLNVALAYLQSVAPYNAAVGWGGTASSFTSLTLIDNAVVAGGPFCCAFRLKNPAVGAKTIRITQNGSTFRYFIWYSSGQDQTTDIGTPVKDVTGIAGTNASPNLSVPSAVGDRIYRFIVTNAAITNITPNATDAGNHVLLGSGNDADSDGVAFITTQDGQATTTDGTISWTPNATGPQLAWAAKAAAAGGGSSPVAKMMQQMMRQSRR